MVQSVLKIDFVLTKNKVGVGGGRRVSAQDAICVGVALAGCRMALVGIGWTISHLVSTNQHRNHSSPLVGAPLLVL